MAWKTNETIDLGSAAQQSSMGGISSNPRWAQAFGQPQQQAPKKKKNFLLDQLSTIGGIGGGILGSLVTPIAGTAAGGAVGSGLGEAIENLIMGESATKNVGKEALLGGIFSAGPIKLAKAGLATGAKALGKEAVEVAGKEVAEGATKRTARNLLGDAWGIRSGVKVNGRVVTPQRAGELQDFLIKQVGVPKTANADMVFSKLTTFQDDAGKAISSAVKTNTTPLNTTGLTTSLQGKFSKVIGANAKENPIATDILTQIKTAKTPEQLWQVRRNIDDSLISFTRNPASAVPGAEQFARSARTEINKVLNKSVPGLSGLNKGYSRALDASELVANAARTPKGAKLPGMLGGIAGPSTQRVRAGAGSALGTLGDIGRNAGTKGITAKGIAGRQIGQNLLIPRASQQPEEQQPATLEDAMMQQGGMDMSGFGQEPQQTSPYGRENLMADIQRDPQNADKYIEYYATMDKIFGVPEAKPLTGEAQKRGLMAESGLRSLDTLASTLQSDPGAFQRQALPNPLGITARLTGTTDVRAATDNVVDVIARLRSGAAITDSEAARFARLLPQPGDSQESAARKIQMVAQELQSFASNPGGGSSLEDALMQYQSQGQGY